MLFLMKTITRRRTAKKLVLPLLAIAMMMSAMYLGSSGGQRPTVSTRR